MWGRKTVPNKHPGATRAALLLPIAFLLHLLEEWFGGFSEWTLVALGNEGSPERFMLINIIAFLFFAIGMLAAVHYPRMAWLATSFAALVGLNGMLHTLASLGLGLYSPGTVTGLLLYLPLSAIVLRSELTRLSGTIFTRAILFGVLLHGLVAYLAFL